MLALGWGLVMAGLRAGDQAGDATVSAVVDAGQLAVVAWCAIPAASRAEFRLPIGIPARRYQLTAVVGQTGGRPRVFRIPVVSERPAGAGRPARAARAGDRG